MSRRTLAVGDCEHGRRGAQPQRAYVGDVEVASTDRIDQWGSVALLFLVSARKARAPISIGLSGRIAEGLHCGKAQRAASIVVVDRALNVCSCTISMSTRRYFKQVGKLQVFMAKLVEVLLCGHAVRSRASDAQTT